MVADLNLDFARPGMGESVEQGLGGNAVDFVAQDAVQRARFAFDSDTG